MNRREVDLIRRRTRAPVAAQTGIEDNHGLPYQELPGIDRDLAQPLSGGIAYKGWINPFVMRTQGFIVPDQTANEPSIVAMQANFRRTYLLIQNKGPGNLFINFGTACSANGGNCFVFVSGQAYEIIGGGGVFPNGDSALAASFIPRDSIWILSDQPATACVIGEGTWSKTGPHGLSPV